MYETLATAAAQRGVAFLACPVLGSVDGARAGTLTLLPGGTSQAFECGRELLGAMGSTIKFTGSPAASGHLKLAYNSMLCVNADAIGELLGIMGRAGVDRTLAIDALVRALERVARQSLHMDAPLMECALAEFEAAVETGLGSEDYIAVGQAQEAC